MGKWNYRVLRSEVIHDGEVFARYRIIEVFYNKKKKITGWVDCADTILDWTGDQEYTYNDLKGSAEHVLNAFNLPVLILNEEKKLVEV